ncbi:sensor domain-containing protein [Nocardiopsis sp. N85]|uniref:sensor histidine kinase n=1 Tax=Nocardiopsis sp. N85 TaxID=3029400 RepID=UPI00237EEB4C|nr:sensor histidine kinase [Nocardiopsis sp. N85]MDE3725183.1 sensor domain-containing protein [Nocardiopsis sp. N85]
MTTGTVRPRTPNTLIGALARPRFLLTPWPWRALLHSVGTSVVGLAVMVITAPIYSPWAMVLGLVISRPWDTMEIGRPSVIGLLVGLFMIVVFAPLVALPVGALERLRLRTVSAGPFNHGHREPPPGLWGWVRTRYTESATWREVAYMFLLMPLSLLVMMILSGLAGAAAVTALAPLLMRDTPDAIIDLGFHTVTTVEQAVPLVFLSPLVVVVLLYASGILAQGHAVIARALLVGPPKEELRAELTEVTDSRARLVDAFEYERRRIERDLHDGAQQRLVALNMDLGMARLDLEEGSEADRRVVAAQRKADDLITELRELVRGIHPRVLTDRGLSAALGELADHSPVPVTVRTDLPRRLPSHVEGTAYFVVAEALTNVYKHTEAATATVHASLLPGPGGDTLVVEVTDHGPGGADPGRGSGLTGMRDRIAVMGGTMDLSSPPGGPTRIRVELPCTIDRTDPVR